MIQLFGSHHLVTRFLKGVFESLPFLPRYQATWNVSDFSNYLRTLGPVKELMLKDLTF
jgi:hypothetical protein